MTKYFLHLSLRVIYIHSFQAIKMYSFRGMTLIKSLGLNKERLLVAIINYITVEMIGKIELLVNINTRGSS